MQKSDGLPRIGSQVAVPRMGARSVWVAAATFALLTLGSCSATDPAGPPKAAWPNDGTALDSDARLDIDPVPYEGNHVVVATFHTVAEGRTVTLQRAVEDRWQDLDTAKLDENRTAHFRTTISDTDTLRVLAAAVTDNGRPAPALATPEANLRKRWTQVLESPFSGERLDRQIWNYANAMQPSDAYPCSVLSPPNVAVADDQVTLAVSSDANGTDAKKARDAGCEASVVYRVGALSTEGHVSMESGTVAIRAKLPPDAGMQGWIGLRSPEGSEIGFLGSGGGELSDVVRIDDAKKPASQAQRDARQDTPHEKKWWSDYHTFSIEWSRVGVVFRLDGEETRRVDQDLPDQAYYLTLDVQPPDQTQVDATATPAQAQPMYVDWVSAWIMAP